MTLDTYGHVLSTSQRAAAEKLDTLFAPTPEFGGQLVVKEATIATDFLSRANRKFNVIRALSLVEMWGLEPQTPYMRSRAVRAPASSEQESAVRKNSTIKSCQQKLA